MCSLPSSHQRAGYTLIELLVVIGLIVLISSFIIFPLSRDRGPRLAAGRQVAIEMVQAARSQAILRAGSGIDPHFATEASAMLIVHNDPTDWERYRRVLGIIYYDASVNGWIAGSPSVILPRGIYFAGNIEREGGLDIVYLDYPSVVPDADLTEGGNSWYVYSFKSTGESLSREARFILRSGFYNPKTSQWESNNPHAFSGFMINKLGGIIELQEKIL